MIQRYLTDTVIEDLEKKMVFIGGPRQVGKTTLSRKMVAPHFRNSAYYSWDNRADRKAIMESRWPGEAVLIILDEFHKYRKWKQHLKGEYDTLHETYRFMVTGSARLDVYRKGGDSLQGRYHYYRMHPLSLGELEENRNPVFPFEELNLEKVAPRDLLEAMDTFGGFPEPFTDGSDRSLRRWHNEKVERLFREDIRDIERILDLGSMQLLGDMLPEKVGSMLSINSIREDLEVSHRAVTGWMNILESFYYCFRLYPYTKTKTRSIKKTPKLYLWDWSEVADEAARFENLLASHLLKLVHYLYDREGYKTGLYYLRNVDGREVDFLVTGDGKPWFAVEAKLSDTKVSSSLLYFQERMAIPYLYQVVKKSGVDFFSRGVRVLSADRFLAGLV
jgi:uncharacterized protein